MSAAFDPKHPDLGWQPAIPEPYWVRRWLRTKPACWPCGLMVFPDREAYGKHWLSEHTEAQP